MELYNNLRYIFGPARSGTSHIQRSLCDSFDAIGVYEPLRYDMIWGHNSLDTESAAPPIKQEFLRRAARENRIVIAKDVLNIYLTDDCVVDLLMGSYLGHVNPVFVFRDPLKAGASIKARNWYPIKSYIENYQIAYRAYERLRDQGRSVMAITHEQFMAHAKDITSKVADFWDVEVVSNGGHWTKSYYDTVHYEAEQKAEVTNSGSQEMILGSEGAPKISRHSPQDHILSAAEVAQLEETVVPLYKRVFRQSL